MKVVAVPPEGSQRLRTVVFYEDMIQTLRDFVSGLRHRERHVVAPDGAGFAVFKLPKV